MEYQLYYNVAKSYDLSPSHSGLKPSPAYVLNNKHRNKKYQVLSQTNNVNQIDAYLINHDSV